MNDDEQERGPAVGGRESVALVEGPRVRWFRGWPLLALIAVSVSAGVALRDAYDLVYPRLFPKQALVSARGIGGEGPLVLDGPGGKLLLPTGKPVVVQVWMQNCADCMDAFDAHKSFIATNAYPQVHVVNVAYGNAEHAWAERYGVHENLVVDAGDKLVKPLGIGTFTTLLIDGEGRIRLRARPTDEGFIPRLHGALQALESGP